MDEQADPSTGHKKNHHHLVHSEWLQTLLSSISVAHCSPITIVCNNNAAITLSEDHLLYARVKHIDIKYLILWGWVQLNDIMLSYVNTKDNIADIYSGGPSVHSSSKGYVDFLDYNNLQDIPCEEEDICGEEEC